jgi:pimeloyl-ACP methyl ester carboxylesterase
MKTGTFTHAGIVFHYDMLGEGNKHVILQHGFSDSADCWGDMPHDLAKSGYHVAMMDARGHGRSGKPDSGYTLDAMTADLAAFIEHIGFDRPVIIGHSMGGSIGGRAASAHKESLRSAVLIDPVFRNVTPEQKEQAMTQRTADILKLKRLSLEEVREATRRKHPEWTEVYIEAGAWGKILMTMGIMEIFKTIDMGWKEDLEKSECPIMLVTAEEELGAIVTRETANWIVKNHKKVQELHITGVGHSIQREKYKELMVSMLAFLAKQY